MVMAMGNEITYSMLATLSIVFVVLKATNVITWSWWVVLVPAYLFMFLFLVASVMLFYAVLTLKKVFNNNNYLKKLIKDYKNITKDKD